MAKKPKATKKPQSNSGAKLGFEAQMWQAADALRGSMDAAEYKHVVLGLIFLKYISDAFEERHAELESQKPQDADPEDRDEYRSQNIFWVPKEARWAKIQAAAKLPKIGQFLDDAMDAIERDNPSLKGVLPRDYAAPPSTRADSDSLLTSSATSALATPKVGPKMFLVVSTSISSRNSQARRERRAGSSTRHDAL